jgi:hypothetical protein
MPPPATTLTITGNPNESVEVDFNDATDFTLIVNGTSTTYTTVQVNKIVDNGPSGVNANVIFYDEAAADAYTATQSLSSLSVVGSNVEFDANNAQTMYAYSTDPVSTATVNLPAGTGANYMARTIPFTSKPSTTPCN